MWVRVQRPRARRKRPCKGLRTCMPDRQPSCCICSLPPQDRERGVVWEETIIFLPDECKMVGTRTHALLGAQALLPAPCVLRVPTGARALPLPATRRLMVMVVRMTMV